MDFNIFKNNLPETFILLGGVLTLVLGTAIMIIENSKLTPNKKTFGILLFFVGSVSATGGFLAAIDNNSKTQKIIDANRKIDSISRLINNASIYNSIKL